MTTHEQLPILLNAMKIPFKRISPQKYNAIATKLVSVMQCNRVYINGVHKSCMQPSVDIYDYVLYNDLYRLATTSAHESYIVNQAVIVFGKLKDYRLRRFIQYAILSSL